MDADLFLVLGVIIGALAIPSVISAFSAGNPPRFAALTIVTGGALIALAVSIKPGGYDFNDIPQVFGSVFSSYLR